MQFARRLIGPLALALGMTGACADPTNPTVDRQNGIVHNTASLAAFNVMGSLMAGITVTAYFGTDASKPLAWKDLGAGEWGVEDGAWSLFMMDDDTLSAPWVLTNETGPAITRLVIDGQPGRIVFDTLEVIDPDPLNSPNSAMGNAMKDSDGTDPTLVVDAVYRNLVQVGGVGYGDVYTTLDINFNSAANGGGMQGQFVFVSDTDAVCTDCRLEPVQPGRVPEPAGLALLGLALVGAGATRRRS